MRTTKLPLSTRLLSLLMPKKNLGYIEARLKISEEDRMSIEFAQWLRQETLEGRMPFVWFHVPNQNGKYLPLFGLKQGWMGRIAGVADYCFVGKESFFIELKAEKGKQSEPQKIFQEWCAAQGIEYVVCKSVEEGMKFVQEKIKQLSLTK